MGNREERLTKRPTRTEWLVLVSALSVVVLVLLFGQHSNGELGTKIASLQKSIDALRSSQGSLARDFDQYKAAGSALQNDLRVVTDKLKITQGQLRKARAEASRANQEMATKLTALDTSVHQELATKAKQQEAAARLRKASDPIWNAWTEQSKKTTYEAKHLQLNEPAVLVVDLAALRYDEDRTWKDAGVYSPMVEPSFGKWLSTLGAEEQPVKITIFPDERYFGHPVSSNESSQDFTIPLRRIRDVQSKGYSLNESALDYLKAHGGKADFDFGSVSFPLHPKKEGVSWIAVIVWLNNRPITEFAYPACIAASLRESCDDLPPRPASLLKGVDLTSPDREPDAALTIVDRVDEQVGVFSCPACGSNGRLSWTVPKRADDFADAIKSIAGRIGRIPLKGATRELYERQFHIASLDLYALIFGEKGENKKQGVLGTQRESGRAAFSEFVATSRNAMLAKKSPSSLFVRLIQSKPELILAPIGMLEVETSNSERPTNQVTDEIPDLVGFYVDLQSPLPEQDYTRSSACYSNWVMLVPPENPKGVPKGHSSFDDVKLARSKFADWIKKFGESCKDCVMDDEDMHNFQDWISGVRNRDADAVIILSHHDGAKGIYFDAGYDSPSISEDSVHRTFQQPSVAILAACGTAEIGQLRWVKALNEHEVYSMIATSTDVAPEMAGIFLTKLLDELEAHKADTKPYTVAEARLNAIWELAKASDSQDVKFGPRAVEFVLVGAGGVRLCPPKAPGDSKTGH